MKEALTIILSILGIAIALYLGITKAKHKKVACLIDGSGCNKVLDSKWSHTLGIRNEWLGFLYYISLIVGIIALSQYNSITIAMKIASSLAFLYSIILTYIQIKILKHYCLYCFCSSLINLGLFIALIID